ADINLLPSLLLFLLSCPECSRSFKTDAEGILSECDSYDTQSSLKRNSLPESLSILGYVTPWNSKGYDVAKIFKAPKLDLISPVWVQLHPDLSLHGLHDIDKGDGDA
ncbi:Chitinase domaincontaining protein 1like, partial [Caligus rogercresseyi]